MGGQSTDGAMAERLDDMVYNGAGLALVTKTVYGWMALFP